MSPAVPSSRYWVFAGVALVALAWDLGTKAWVFAELGYPFRSSAEFASFDFLWGHVSGRLTTSFNEGALWGIGQGLTWLFASLSLVAVVFVLYWLFIRGEAVSWWLTVTLALVMAGTLGNLYDRLYLHGCVLADGRPQGGVRDFLHFRIPMLQFELPFRFTLIPDYEWPIFNFADTYLVAGAILLTLHAMIVPPRQTESPANSVTPTSSGLSAGVASEAGSAGPESSTSSSPQAGHTAA